MLIAKAARWAGSPMALNPIDLTCFQTASSLWTWISLHWKSRCGSFSGCVRSSTSLYGNIQGQDCIVQDTTQFCTLSTGSGSMIVGDTWGIPVFLCKFTQILMGWCLTSLTKTKEWRHEDSINTKNTSQNKKKEKKRKKKRGGCVFLFL